LSLLNGARTSLPCSVSGVSNISLTLMATSSEDRTKQHSQHIISQLKREAQSGKSKGFTRSRVATRIGELQGLESQLLLAAKWVDSPKNKFFGAVARLEPGLKEFSHPHYQRPQSRPLFRILPLISNYRWKKVLVRPLRRVAQIDMKPPPG
jgi:hypothetical protein